LAVFIVMEHYPNIPYEGCDQYTLERCMSIFVLRTFY